MRFSYAESMTDPSYYAPLARAAEEAGFDGFVVPDSIFYPREAKSTYPFNPDGSREFLEDKAVFDPFCLASALGAVTEKIRFVTFVLKLPVRNPVLVAKQATSAAVLTGGRLALGVGISPWREDYTVLGVPFEGRGSRMDEAIEALRGLCAGGYFEYHGKTLDFDAIKMAPVPQKRIPILIGGHSDAALRRAVTKGDGWLHGGGDPAELPALLTRLAELGDELRGGHGFHTGSGPGDGHGFHTGSGPGDGEFEVHVISADAFSVDGIARLEELGVTDVIVGFRWPYVTGADTEALQTKIDNLHRYAETVIHKL